MPNIIDHPGIPGAKQVILTPSEPRPGGSVGVTVILDKTRVKGTSGSPATIHCTVIGSKSLTSITPSVSPADAEITFGTITGSGTTRDFDITVAKTGTYEVTRTIVVNVVATDATTGTGAASFIADDTPPATPGSVTAVGVTSGIQITWAAVSATDLATYIIYSSATSGGTYTEIGRTAATSFTDTGLSAGTTKFYKVSALDTVGNESAQSAFASASALGDIKLTLSLAKTRVGGSDTFQAALTADQSIDSTWLLRSISPTDTDITFGTISPSGAGTSYTFNVIVSKATVGTFTRTLIVQLDTGLSGGKSGVASATFIVDTQAPGVATSLSVSPRIQSARVTWTAPSDTDISYYLVYRNTTNSIPGTYYGKTIDTSFLDSAMDSNTQYFYWVKAVDTVGNIGSASSSATGTTLQVVNTDIQNSAISLAKFASGLQGIQVVSSLGAISSPTQGMVVFLTTDSKLYRYTGSAWTVAIPTTDLTGQITNVQIANNAVDITKFASGLQPVQIVSSLASITSPTQGMTALLTTDNKLYRYTGSAWTTAVPAIDITGLIAGSQISPGSIDLTKFGTGLQPIQVVSSLGAVTSPTQGVVVMLTTDNKLYRYTGSAWTVAVPAADLTGQIGETQIADNAITTQKIFAEAVTANQIRAGTITATQIAADTITATQIAAGTITATELAANSVTALQIAANIITASHIASHTITANEIFAGTITATEIHANTITAAQIATDTITAAQIAAGAITTSELAAGSITASKLAVGFGGGGALNEDPNTGDASAWTVSGGTVSAITLTDGKVGNTSIRSSTNNAVTLTSKRKIPVDVLKSYRIRAWVRRDATANGTIYIGAALQNSAGVNIPGPTGTFWYVAASNQTPTANVWTEYTGILGVAPWAYTGSPATMTCLALMNFGGTTGYYEVQDFRIEEVLPGTLIGDGVITTNKLAAHAVTADTIFANTITSGQIAAHTITANEIAAHTITATEILAHTITAGEIFAGTITATELAANSVTATKLAVVDIAYDPGHFFNNNPSAGRVSWSGLTIVANGVASNITNGSTTAGTDYYLWWKASAPTSLQQSVRSTAGLFTDTSFTPGTDFLVGYTVSGVFNQIWNGTVVTGDQIMTGTIVAKHISVNTLCALTADLGTITAGIIQDAASATTTRGIRFSSSYGIPTHWNDDAGIFMDFASSFGVQNTFLRVGQAITVDWASSTTVNAAFRGFFSAENLSGTSAGFSGTIAASNINTAGFTVQASGPTLGYGSPDKARFTYGSNDSFTIYAEALQSTASSGTANTTNTLNDDNQLWGTDQFASNSYLTLLSGNAAGESRLIVNNTRTTLTVSPAFSLAPSANAQYKINNVRNFTVDTYTTTVGGTSTLVTRQDTSWAPTTNTDVTRSTAGSTLPVSTGTGPASGDTITNGGGVISPTGDYTVTWDQRIDSSGLSVTLGSVTVVSLNHLYYRTSSGGSFIDTGIETTLRDDWVGGPGPAARTTTQNVVFKVPGTPAYVEFKIVPGITIGFAGKSLTGSALSRVVGNTAKVVWTTYTAGTGVQVSRRNPRLFSNSFWTGSALNFAPHITMEPLSVKPSDSLGREGDVVFAAGALHVHNGSSWFSIGATASSSYVLKGGDSNTGTYTWSGAQIMQSSLSVTGPASFGGTATINSTLSVSGAITQGGNSVVHTGNLNSLGDTRWAQLNAANHFSALQTFDLGIIGGFGATNTNGVLNWNDISNARSGNGYSLLLGTALNGPSDGTYFHPFNFEYGVKDGSGNITQFAIPYASPAADMYMRGRYAGVWSNWIRFVNSNNFNSFGDPRYTRPSVTNTWTAAQIFTALPQFYSGVNSAGETGSALRVRELNIAGAQTGVPAESPRINFYWSGRISRQLGMDSSGTLHFWDSSGNLSVASHGGAIFGALAADSFSCNTLTTSAGGITDTSLSANIPRLNLANTFSSSGNFSQTVASDAGSQIYWGISRVGVGLKALFGIAGVTGQLIPGTVADDAAIRTEGGRLLFSIDSGNSAAGIISPSKWQLGITDIGRSGGDYPRIGYNFNITGSAGSYTYRVTDNAAVIVAGQSNVGSGFLFQAASGSAGAAIAWNTLAEMHIGGGNLYGTWVTSGTHTATDFILA